LADSHNTSAPPKMTRKRLRFSFSTAVATPTAELEVECAIAPDADELGACEALVPNDFNELDAVFVLDSIPALLVVADEVLLQPCGERCMSPSECNRGSRISLPPDRTWYHWQR
jgi:hypothetical protein